MNRRAIIEFDYSGTIAGAEAALVAAEAEKRGVSPAELMMRIVETVLRDDLISAVLDDGGANERPRP